MVTTTQQVKGSYLIIASGNEQFPQLGYLTYLDALIKTTFSSATTSAKQKEEHTHIIYICTSVCISNFLLACCRSLAAKKKQKHEIKPANREKFLLIVQTNWYYNTFTLTAALNVPLLDTISRQVESSIRMLIILLRRIYTYRNIICTRESKPNK